MEWMIEPATLEIFWTAALGLAIVATSGLCLLALPWSDREIAKVDARFRVSAELSQDSLPLQTLS